MSLFNSVIQIHGSGSTSGSQITLNDLVLTGANSSNFGGGVAFAGSSATGESLTINRCHITLNSSLTGGAGMSATNVETVSVNDSTLSDNSTSSVGGAINQTLGTINLNNSTLSGNSASSGGGMYLSGAGSVIRSSTIYNNDDGMVVFGPGSDIDMKNSIISGNIGSDCDSPFPTPSNLISNGYNVLGSLGTCVLTGPQTGDASGNPMLAALADNGGNTPTHALLAGSPAIDNGDPTGCTDSGGALLAYDQRGPGFDRALDGDDNGSVICDSGAFEAAGTIDEEDVEDAIENLDDIISNAPATDFKNGNPQNAFMKKLNSVLNQLEQIANETDPGIREGLINQLKSKLVNDILAKSNGCPDEPDNNDWVTDCDLQIEIQGWVDSILNLLDQL